MMDIEAYKGLVIDSILDLLNQADINQLEALETFIKFYIG